MRTIFGKQLVLYLGILSLSFVLLGAVLSQAIRSYFTERQIDFLQDAAERLAVSFEDIVVYGIISRGRIDGTIIQMRQFLKAAVVMVDTDFNVTADPDNITLHNFFGIKEYEQLAEGKSVVVYGNPGGAYREPRLTVGRPLVGGEYVISSLLVSTSAAELEETIFGMYRLTIICLCATAAVLFVLVYFSCRAITKPLQQMNEAAGVIAAGDFEKRIAVKSRDETGQLARSFNHMAESLQEQEKIRRAFIADISHDLRSPLTSIRGFLQAIGDGTVPAEKQQHYFSIILEESERLIKLSNDMLDVNRIQSSDFAPSKEDFDLNALIRKAAMLFEKRATDKRLSISCRFAHETDFVFADEDMIRRVMCNLLDNAVKFSAAGSGAIEIETTAQNKKVSVSVKDCGRGMTEEDRKRVFDRFFKGDASRGEDKRGSGLGLSIVRDFLRAHGESIAVESEPGKGSVFVFELPLSEIDI